MIVHALTQGVGCASRQAWCVASTSTQWSPQHRLHCCVILSATRRTAPTPRPRGGACAALLRSRCHRTHRRHLRQCLPRTARPPATQRGPLIRVAPSAATRRHQNVAAAHGTKARPPTKHSRCDDRWQVLLDLLVDLSHWRPSPVRAKFSFLFFSFSFLFFGTRDQRCWRRDHAG